MWSKKLVYVLSYLKSFKAVHKINPRTQSPQLNKKAVLTTAAYFKVSTHVLLQGQKLYFFLSSFTKKGVSGIKPKKQTPLLNSAYSN